MSKGTSKESKTTVALLPWGDTWEDWFDSVDITFEEFCNEHTGGWKNNYIDALMSKNINVIMIYATSRVTKPSRYVHKPTGAIISLLPTTRLYKSLRKTMVHPYPSMGYYGNFEDLFGKKSFLSKLCLKLIKHIAPFTPLSICQLNKELKYHKCNAILCQDYEQSRFDLAILIGRLNKTPVYATFQSGKKDFNIFGRLVKRYSMKSCDGFLIGTSTEIDRIKNQYGIADNQIHHLFNPVTVNSIGINSRENARAVYNISNTTKAVVWHGRIDFSQKGLDILLSAWKQLCAELPQHELTLMLLGSGVDSEKLQILIKSLALKNVSWINEFYTDRFKINRFLLAGDIYAFPSRYEGFPVAPLEAMACGLPVVATNADGIADIFGAKGKHGGIVVPIDDTEAFTRALRYLIVNDEKRVEMAAHARKRVVKGFSIDAIGAQLKTIFEPSLGSKNIISQVQNDA